MKTEAVPWTGRQVADVAAKLPARYAAMAYLGAACGPRQGELFALAVDDIDFLRRSVRVEVQLKRVRGQLCSRRSRTRRPATSRSMPG